METSCRSPTQARLHMSVEKKLDKIIEEEQGFFDKFIKDTCVVCKGTISKPRENYYARGNYCAPCNAAIRPKAKNAKKIKEIFGLKD